MKYKPIAYRLSPIALSVALIACTPSATKQTSSLPLGQAPNLISALHPREPRLSPESIAALRSKYGPFVKIGLDQNFWQRKKLAENGSLERFKIQNAPSGDNFSQCEGTFNEFDYQGIGKLRDLGASFCYPGTTYEGFETIESCYSSGGIPVYENFHICEFQEADGCFQTKFQGVLHECQLDEAGYDLFVNPDLVNRSDSALISVQETEGVVKPNWLLSIKGMDRSYEKSDSGNFELSFGGRDPNDPSIPDYWPDGDYTVTLKYQDKSAQEIEKTQLITLIRGSLKALDVPEGEEEVYLGDALVFSPRDQNGQFDQLHVIYGIRDEAWRMELLAQDDLNGAPWWTHSGPDQQTVIWDGFSEGNCVPENKYVLRTSDSEGNLVSEASLAVDSTPPLVKELDIQVDVKQTEPEEVVETTVKFQVFDPLIKGVAAGLNLEKWQLQIDVDDAPLFATPLRDPDGFWVASALPQNQITVESVDPRTAKVEFKLPYRLDGRMVKVRARDRVGNQVWQLIQSQGGLF